MGYNLVLLNYLILSMKRSLTLTLLLAILFASVAPISKVEAFNNFVIESSSGMHVYAPTPHEMNPKNFKLKFVIKIPQYTDAQGKIHYYDDYSMVNWNIQGCGISEKVQWNREENYDQLVNTMPQIEVTGKMPTRNCTITTWNPSVAQFSSAKPCEPGEDGVCRNTDMIFQLPLTLDLSFRERAIRITGPRRVMQGSNPTYESTFDPTKYVASVKPSSDSEPKVEVKVIDTAWNWQANSLLRGTCSRETSHDTLNPTYYADIHDTYRGSCRIVAKAGYVTETNGIENGVRFGLNYIRGYKNIIVAENR